MEEINFTLIRHQNRTLIEKSSDILFSNKQYRVLFISDINGKTNSFLINKRKLLIYEALGQTTGWLEIQEQLSVIN